MANGRLEARITVPSGGWTVTLTDGLGGPTAVVLPAGTYYMSSVGSLTEGLWDALTTAANAAMGETWAFFEGANGKTSVTVTDSLLSGIGTITFTDTELRDILGFASDQSGNVVYTSTKQAKALWLPEYPFQTLNGGPDWNGWWETNQANSENANGNTFSLIGRKKRINSVTWPVASRAKCWVSNETITNESFEQFLLDGVWAGATWGTSAGPLRFYGDETDATIYATYAAFGLENWKPSQIRQHWTGAWVITLPRLVEVP